MIVPADCSVQKEMRRYIDASSPIIEYIDNLFLSRNISLDWWTDLNWSEDQVYSLLTSCCWRHQFILFIVIYSALVGGGCSPFFLCRTHGLVLCIVKLHDNSSTTIDILSNCPQKLMGNSMDYSDIKSNSSMLLSPIHGQISFLVINSKRYYYRQVLCWAISKLNAEVEEREERKEKWIVSLQPVSTQAPKFFYKIDKWVIYINGGELNHYTNGLRNTCS